MTMETTPEPNIPPGMGQGSELMAVKKYCYCRGTFSWIFRYDVSMRENLFSLRTAKLSRRMAQRRRIYADFLMVVV
jgi:hypothetical protein